MPAATIPLSSLIQRATEESRAIWVRTAMEQVGSPGFQWLHVNQLTFEQTRFGVRSGGHLSQIFSACQIFLQTFSHLRAEPLRRDSAATGGYLLSVEKRLGAEKGLLEDPAKPNREELLQQNSAGLCVFKDRK
ncbi:hypothetical protein ACMFMG_007777 [Clarireedia jacksonii]